MCSWCSRVRIKATVIESPKCFAVIPTPGSTLVVGNIHVGVNTSRSPSKEEGRWAGETIRTHAVIGALYLFLAKSVLRQWGHRTFFGRKYLCYGRGTAVPFLLANTFFTDGMILYTPEYIRTIYY